MADRTSTPNVIAPPPLIFAGGIVAGFVAQWLLPLAFVPGIWRWVLAAALILAGLLLGFAAFGAMARARTPVDPYEPSTAVVTDGPYRFSRNPIYLGFALITLGIASAANTGWIVLFLLPALLLVDRGVIAREERYLEGKFGETYARYKSRVRRWI